VVVADSLLHAAQQGSLGDVAGQSKEAWAGAEFALEDEAAKDVLLRRYAVVGNPPYITVKDAVLRERIQPSPSADGERQPCRRGHYFVQIADRDHIFFEYTAKETSEAVRLMFKAYDGYVQADAKSVYDTLFREPESEDGDAACTEIGCWSHARTKFWEATTAKYVVAREGLARIARIFEIDRGFKDKSPHEIQRLRRAHLQPHLDGFMVGAEQQYELVKKPARALARRPPLRGPPETGPLARDRRWATRPRE
jgi:hypothetical protein